ncbi:hypothetical protein NQ314_015326 [Rhamnusium bicolor]|uniref:Glycolipid transfer protein domain-containing protein n=1 Tax=Rhamnusium bicolor TaxID=1586634 RepID=A0AAV8WZ70_9CUCU|nr:hypothetical protein NQ314_015326 [Rhamnusium bicolor]
MSGVIDDTLSERCSPDLTPLIKNAYSATLEEYHGWLGTQLFNVLSRFAPNRRHLFYTLALESSNHDSFVIRDMQAFIGKMKDCVRRLRQFYQTHNLESYANL